MVIGKEVNNYIHLPSLKIANINGGVVMSPNLFTY